MHLWIRRAALCLALAPLAALAALGQAAGTCQSGQADTQLYINNVRARILNNGNLFWGGSLPVYEVPQGSGINAIFTTSLWVGGMVGGVPRAAGSRYGPYEFFPGPLNDDGTPPSPGDCSAFDHIYNVSRLDLDTYESTGEATDDLANWPWQLGAPVLDGDGNPDNYDLAAGDRPALLGHQTAWWVMNDAAGVHALTGGDPIGLEVQAAAFSALQPSNAAVNNATLYRYRLVHKGNAPLEAAYVGLFVDADLGNFSDDYIGVDTLLGLAYTYNADDFDEGDYGYGAAPPALGLVFLEGPPAEADGLDNDHDGFVDEDGEQLGLAHFGDFLNGGGVRGTPVDDSDFYNYLQGRWRDGRRFKVGGLGYDSLGTPTNYLYTGDPVTGAFWSERNLDGAGTPATPADRRYFLSMGPFDMAPGEEQTVTVAIVWARGSDHLDAITQLRAAAADLQAAWAGGFDIPFMAEPPSQAPPLLAPADGTAGQARRLTLHWGVLNGSLAYDVELATDAAFTDVVRSEHILGATALDLADLLPQTTYYWRVRAKSPGGYGPWSAPAAFTTGNEELETLGPLLLSDGTPAFVEVAGPGGIDPCGATAVSTFGCDEVAGNFVYGSLNSTGDYTLYHLGPVGAEDRIGQFAPHDFEIRFTAEGSYAYHLFTTGRVSWVPFEVWDIGATPPGAANDPADDRRMIPVLYADQGGECTFGYGEVPGPDNPLGLGWSGTERIYAFYGTTSYADWEAAVGSLVEGHPGRCLENFDGIDLIDLTLDRPLQRLVFFGNESGSQYRDAGPPEGVVVRFYTPARLVPPLLAAPADGEPNLTQPVTLWWNTQVDTRGGQPAHVQVATTPDFTTLVVDDDSVGTDHLMLPELPGGAYYWRVRRRSLAGMGSDWSDAWHFVVGASKLVNTEEEAVPEDYVLDQNYPNPFNPATTIRFALPQASPVTLHIYDVLGRRVATLVDNALPAGWHTVTWDAARMSSGLYLYQIEAGRYRASRRMLLMK